MASKMMDLKHINQIDVNLIMLVYNQKLNEVVATTGIIPSFPD